MRIQTGLDITQAFTPGHLGICKAQKLIKRGKTPCSVVATITTNAQVELMPWQQLQQLPENSMTRIHRYPPVKTERYKPIPLGRIQIENVLAMSKNYYYQRLTSVCKFLTGQ